MNNSAGTEDGGCSDQLIELGQSLFMDYETRVVFMR